MWRRCGGQNVGRNTGSTSDMSAEQCCEQRHQQQEQQQQEQSQRRNNTSSNNKNNHSGKTQRAAPTRTITAEGPRRAAAESRHSQRNNSHRKDACYAHRDGLCMSHTALFQHAQVTPRGGEAWRCTAARQTRRRRSIGACPTRKIAVIRERKAADHVAWNTRQRRATAATSGASG